MVTTRFAPSPTGRLHVGNLRTALHNWLLARRAGGRFLLRIDDTDAERSREAYVDAIRRDLDWLGLRPDGEVRQSARLDLYKAAFARLVAEGRVYPAYETAQELELKRKVRLGRGLPPIYDRAALRLSAQERRALEEGGRRPHWRFRLDHDQPIVWHDAIRGEQRFDPAQLSDPVVRRADGSWLYMLPSVVDDIDMNITDVLRGEDHVSNTAVQVQIFAALGRTPPRFAHEALLVGDEGKLSKRLGSIDCDTLRARGIEPDALAALLARLGTSRPVEPVGERGVLVEEFDLSLFSRAPARFSLDELDRLNRGIVHQLPFERVAGRLPDGIGEAAWLALRPNLGRVADAGDWLAVLSGPLAPPALEPEDQALAALAAERLTWSATPWQDLTAALKTETGRSGRALFLPLRLALTGRAQGPDMAALLPLIGEREARARLRAAAGLPDGAEQLHSGGDRGA
ncbi:glutamate--tRNA ligase [Erythrobacteraceae bacterium CFH 75059]|uniref:glutamate--tRNA ligase n=1 Tax=Qipengyuania thermophila TaxID=2509361 RepID=UPI00101EB86F|nr:glutamate--tRNA ligase [Qipengyuania thermophila]TCD06925.1 glutamate--tRNA ligase [Erythrobacteraceae bacterium CFH 75059]